MAFKNNMPSVKLDYFLAESSDRVKELAHIIHTNSDWLSPIMTKELHTKTIETFQDSYDKEPSPISISESGSFEPSFGGIQATSSLMDTFSSIGTFASLLFELLEILTNSR